MPPIPVLALLCAALPGAPPPGGLVYDRLAPGFVRETRNASGFGTGFERPNPWGAYTAYHMDTDSRGLRTWRIENYVPMADFLQGSTMYLLEGAERALLIDTAQPTPTAPGKPDLVALVRHLLAHDDQGRPRPNPVDFVVANTHFHFDHTGENARMADRTVHYPEGDWPEKPPANYVPVREGGGGKTVGQIALGGRTVEVVRLHGHTPGSTGYLDRAHRFVVTGDALGSGVVWMHFGPVSVYADSLRHLQKILAPLDDPAVLPAHFYQIDAGDRARPPVSGHLLDRAYVDDQLAAAQGTLDGNVVAEPYRIVGRDVLLATVRTAGMTFSLQKLHADPKRAGPWHAVRIPGTANASQVPSPIDGIRSGFFLIRERGGNCVHLIVGSERALLVGTGTGTPGLPALVRRLAGSVPVDVLALSDDPGQIGGLRAFAGHPIFFPRSAPIPRGLRNVVAVGRGDRLPLGKDAAGRPALVRIEPLPGHTDTGLTALSVADRVLLAGDALGAQAADGGLYLRASLTEFAAALAAWRGRTDGAYDVVYTSRNAQWTTSPAFVDQVQEAVRRGIDGGPGVWEDSRAAPGHRVVRSTGKADVVASVVVPVRGQGSGDRRPSAPIDRNPTQPAAPAAASVRPSSESARR